MSKKQAHPTSDWLTVKYVEQKLQIYFKEKNLKVQKLDIKPATSNGENFASVLTRINVDYFTDILKNEPQHATFLVKTTLAENDPASHLLKDYGIYVREMIMYEEVLPQLAELLRRELHDERKLFAATVCVDRPKNSITFEDLGLEQYKLVNRLDKLDLPHTHLVLEKLAQFHALSAALNERKPGIFSKNYDRNFFNRHTRGYQSVYENLLRGLSRSLELDNDLKKRYQLKINKLIDRIMDYGEKSTDIRKSDFVTLLHGDVWSTNLMFNYNAQDEPSNCILIDFQFCVWNSPALDLHYFFNSSIHEDLRLNHQTELVQFYYNHLVRALAKLKYNGLIPSLFDFQLQFRAHSFNALYTTLIFEPVMLYNGPELATIEKLMTNTESAIKLHDSLYQNETLRKKLHIWLPIFDQIGLLDDM
ncbi:uncharacterized protein Dwil_GK12927 [Drosophila willistoni]|uniref:CHK kinase-like domain-containing protein n=1 Tax=Drosophila willistoni TaxID=7260 RepID=B4NIU6_DROWI|nr:uncharacterized protein LOC6651255 [Drosophila willistoni]EDW84848.1 uncharacterized protein Dwil_GK12927 [Drosophila willistoni]